MLKYPWARYWTQIASDGWADMVWMCECYMNVSVGECGLGCRVWYDHKNAIYSPLYIDNCDIGFRHFYYRILIMVSAPVNPYRPGSTHLSLYVCVCVSVSVCGLWNVQRGLSVIVHQSVFLSRMSDSEAKGGRSRRREGELDGWEQEERERRGGGWRSLNKRIVAGTQRVCVCVCVCVCVSVCVSFKFNLRLISVAANTLSLAGSRRDIHTLWQKSRPR